MKTQLQNLRTLVSITFIGSLLAISFKANAAYYYQLKIYHFKSKAQEDRLDNYFKDAYIPALHRAGLTGIGVFKPLEQDTDKRVYVLIPVKSWKVLEHLDEMLSTDQTYNNDGSDYINAVYNDYPYTRIEIIFLRAIQPMPEPVLPILTGNRDERIYELRSYENPTEKAGLSKMKMFDEGGEGALFKKLDFNAVFYGKVIAGNRMPNLMYMTVFNNKTEREEHWNKFAGTSEWKAIVSKNEFQHNLNNASKWFLQAAQYADF
jgi:hypothetical protein